MGLLINGQWRDQWYDTSGSGGRFLRKDSAYRNWMTVDGAPGPTGHGGFPAELGRYHLYVSLACPWAHRTLILRSLRGSRQPSRRPSFTGECGKTAGLLKTALASYPTQILGLNFSTKSTSPATQITLAASQFQCYGTNAEARSSTTSSSEIIRMMNCAFNALGAKSGDYYPEELQLEIESVNMRVYDTLNNGVYKAGFATSRRLMKKPLRRCSRRLTGLNRDWLQRVTSSATG